MKKANYIRSQRVRFHGVNNLWKKIKGGKNMTDLENFVNQSGRDKLVKDVRTNVESTDAERVLGGDLEEFIKAIFNGLWFIKTNNFLIAF